MGTQEVTVPDLGEADAEGELVDWLIAPGDSVAADQPVAEVETDKAVVEVHTPVAGVVAELRAAEGDTVAEGATIAVVDSEASETAVSGTGADREKAAVDSGPSEPDAGEQGSVPEGRVFAPPRIRRIARERGVDIAGVEGSGPGGRITERDVLEAAERGADRSTDSPGPRSVSGGKAAVTRRDGVDEHTDSERDSDEHDGESTPTPRSLSGGKSIVRRPPEDAEIADRTAAAPADEAATEGAAAERTIESTTLEAMAEDATDEATARSAATPSAAAGARRTIHHDEADVTDLLAVRDRLAGSVEAADVTLTALPFAVAAVTRALRRVPELNGSDDGESRADINVAVGVPTADGLRRPVVVDADEARLLTLARELDDTIERAREDRLADAETADATFTVTDFGALGGTYADPDLDAAGTAVLALGAIRTLPRIHEGEIVPRDVVTLSTAVDARAVDGAVATRFTNEVRRYLNTPELLLLE